MNNKLLKYIPFIFFSVYFLLGIFIYKDFGIGIEEHFQRKNGFFWLIHFFEFFDFTTFKDLAKTKYEAILNEYPNLPETNYFNFYGIFFDLPLAFAETVFTINDSKTYFELRHLSIFIIFFISSITFYKILKERFIYNYIIYIGLLFYVGSPRVFGDSFHNNKDILFLSLLTLSIYFLLKYFKKIKNKHLILFCLFSAFATSTRIMGIYLPILLIFFIFIEYLTNKINISFFIKQSFKIIFFYLIFLYLHYPYMWELNILELSSWFKKFFYWMNIKILFNGEYYTIKYLPRSYLPLWIIISTPFIILLFSFLGFTLLLQRSFLRLINIKKDKIVNSDFWLTDNEKFDFFIFLSFLSFFIYAVLLNVAMLSGWRHFYFLHIFLVYFSTISINYLHNYFRKKIDNKYFYFLSPLILVFLIYENSKFHPYQSLYFNNFLNKKSIEKFQVDTPSLSRSHALNFILSQEKGKQKIYVGNASWTPFRNGKDILTDDKKERFIFVGQEFDEADYIYTNYIYKNDEKYNKNYKIPSEFKKIKEFFIEDVNVFSVYKR